MSNKEQDKLREEAEKTYDVTLKEKLKQAAKSKEQAIEIHEEIELEELENQQQAQANNTQPRPGPQWLSPALKAALNLVGFDNKQFNQKNFVNCLKHMGITKFLELPNQAGFVLNYGKNNAIEINLHHGIISTNDFSKQGFTHLARVAKETGAHGLNMSEFIKDQKKANNPNLTKMLTDAYHAAKTEGLVLTGMEAEQDLLSKLESSVKTP